MQNDGDARHPLHDKVEVIGNNAAKGFHCAGKDVAIDAHHVLRLLEFDVHVFHHFRVKEFGIGVDGFDARHERFIAADTRVEVHEALLQVAQFEQVVVAEASLKPIFGVIDGDVDLLQEFFPVEGQFLCRQLLKLYLFRRLSDLQAAKNFF